MTRKPPVAREPRRAAATDSGGGRAIRWRSAEESGDLPDDPVLSGWLHDHGSLTGRIRRWGGAGFSLEVLSEGFEPATAEDRRHLDCRDLELYVRRVRMSCAGIRLVFASTRVPRRTLAGHPWLARLRHRPLGEALADRSNISRTPFEYAWVDSGNALHAEALAGSDIAPPGLWARRSRFLIERDPILVYEVFLPDLTRFGSG